MLKLTLAIQTPYLLKHCAMTRLQNIVNKSIHARARTHTQWSAQVVTNHTSSLPPSLPHPSPPRLTNTDYPLVYMFHSINDLQGTVSLPLIT